jgi:hypothetical protein
MRWTVTAQVVLTTFVFVPAIFAADIRVTRDYQAGSYLRYIGTSDALTTACSTGRRSQWEPSVAVDPTLPTTISIAANDSCTAAGDGSFRSWPSLHRSIDGGQSWHSALLPGYPGDTTPASLASPVYGYCNEAGDTTQAFDRIGNLFLGFVCHDAPEGNERLRRDFSAFVAVYDEHGANYRSTTIVGAGTPSTLTRGLGMDKPNLAVDQTIGSGSGNIYVAWTREEGASENLVIMFSRSVDHGVTFSPPTVVAAGTEGGMSVDVAVGPSGTVHLVWRSFSHSGAGKDGIMFSSSRDFGQSFGRPQHLADIVPFDSDQYSGNGADACSALFAPCPSGFTFPRFSSFAAVAADDAGVHVVWNGRNLSGQSKVFVLNSPDGISFPTPAVQIDSIGTGHQWFPDVASSDARSLWCFTIPGSIHPMRPACHPETLRRGETQGQSWTRGALNRPMVGRPGRSSGSAPCLSIPTGTTIFRRSWETTSTYRR